MDFELQYTKEQEEFRKEVRSWLEQNAKVPDELGKLPLEEGEMTWEMFQWGPGLPEKAGRQGLALPNLPQ